jgi:hypothetical protein
LYQKLVVWLLPSRFKPLPLKTTPKNYSISGYQIAPKISYLFSKVRLGYILRTTKQSDRIQKHCCKIDLAHPFPMREKKITVNLYQNKFNGDPFSSVGFQMLEGLQQAETSHGDYWPKHNAIHGYQSLSGTKSEFSNTIHGNVQLRPTFK